MPFAFELAPCLYEHFGRNAKLLRNGDEIRLMRFEKAYDGREKPGFADPSTQLVCPDSGQVDEPLSPPIVTQRCRKRGKGDSLRVSWRMIEQSLTFSRKLVGGANWPRS